VSVATCKTILFIDFENRAVDLKSIPEEVFVPMFFGALQKSVPKDLLKAAVKLGERLKLVDIEGQGKNALDFHIAFYLGEYLVATPTAACIILSGDTGFDPLVKHLCGRGFSVRRAGSINEAFPVPAAPGTPHVKAAAQTPTKPRVEKATVSPYGSVLEFLKEMPARNRPRKRKALMAHLQNHFARKISAAELGKVVDRMLAEQQISETEGKIGYRL
jgi:hypothetical protein